MSQVDASSFVFPDKRVCVCVLCLYTRVGRTHVRGLPEVRLTLKLYTPDRMSTGVGEELENAHTESISVPVVKQERLQKLDQKSDFHEVPIM